MNRQLVSVTDAVPYQEFAKLIGKTPRAVRGMIEKGNYQLLRLLTLSQYRGVLVNIGYTFRHGITD